MFRRRFSFALPLFSSLALISLGLVCVFQAGCGGGSPASNTGPITPVLTSISVSPVSPSVNVGASQQFTATAKDSNGNTISGITFTWASSATSVASINTSSGLANAVSAGTAQITATAQGVTSPANTLTVIPVLTSISVSPASPTVTVGGSQQFTATAKDSNGNIMSGITFTWASSATGVASINTSSGLASAISAGTTQISASAQGVTGPADTLTVTAAQLPTSISLSAPPALSSLGLPLKAIAASILDQSGNLDTAATGSVTLALSANPTGATLSGTLQEPVINGIATFSNLALEYPGAGYTLTASYLTLPSVTSPAFTVLPSHSSLISVSGESTTPSNWWTHTSASFPVTASTTGNLVLSTLDSQLDNQTAVPWAQEPQDTLNYSSLASSPYTVAVSAQDQTGAIQVSTLTWVDCANTDTATSQPMPPTSSTCATLAIPESVSADKFAGFADPTMRKDPVTGLVWLGYSWPSTWNAGTGNATDVVSLHLASSSDNGVTWSTPTDLWNTEQTTDPSNGNTAYTSNEVFNILPGQVTGQSGETWFGIHLNYYVDQGISIVDSLVPHSTMVLNWATSPTALGSVPASQTVRFAAAGMSAGIPFDVNLTTLDPSLADCQQWAEPALYMKNGNLYMILMCKFGTSPTQLAPKYNFYGVFETTPNLSVAPSTWTWQYNGQLASAADGALLEGHEFVYELDLATRADGTVVAIVSPADDLPSPSDPTTAIQYTYGCRALLVKGLDKGNIGLALDANGQLEVLASITASDLGPANGDADSGACTYEPLASNGIVFVRVYSPDTRFPGQGYYVGLFNTYIMP